MSYTDYSSKKQLSWAAFLALLLSQVTKYDYDQIDPSLKPRDVPQEELYDSYDFIIVGGGISGCILARRLTEIKQWKVLMMEAGGDDNIMARIPLLHPLMWEGELAWNFTTVPQKYVCRENGGICKVPRGKGLGGTSLLYDMVYIRGNPITHDLIYPTYGLPSWSFKEILPYYKKAENFTGLNRPYSPNLGYNGPLSIQSPVWHSLFRKNYIPAGQQIGFIYRNYNDINQSNSIDYPHFTIDGFSRLDAARAYIYPVKDRKNLHIIKYSMATKILFKGKKAIGVEYLRDEKKYTVYASKEVLISAGPFNSPKLLMLSGIGPEKELRKFKIKCVADLPVGKYLQDIVGTTITFQIKSEDTMTSSLWKTKLAIDQYTKERKGPLTTNGIGAIAINRGETEGFPPDLIYAIQTIRWQFEEPQDVPIISIKISLMRPESTGYLTLKSTDPLEDPLIDPKYLTAKNDSLKLEEGMRVAFKYMATPAMKVFSPRLFTDDHPKCSGLSTQRKFIKCMLKNYVESHLRPTGTTRAGAESDPETVVVYNTLVKGFSNLRVVASSSRPPVASGPTYGVTYAVAERAADYIKEKYGFLDETTPPPIEPYETEESYETEEEPYETEERKQQRIFSIPTSKPFVTPAPEIPDKKE